MDFDSAEEVRPIGDLLAKANEQIFVRLQAQLAGRP